MAIIRLDQPTVPNPVSGDWAKIAIVVSKSFQNINNPLQVNGSVIPQGAVFQFGGIIYIADSDTAISGGLSDYVKLTPNAVDSGATVDASFVSALTGVSWNKVDNGYYDVSGNMYLFDEVKAIRLGVIAIAYTKLGSFWNNNFDQQLTQNSDVTFAGINTGQGANNLYAMDQSMREGDNITFNSLTLTDKLSLAVSLESSVQLYTSSDWTVPRGFYIVAAASPVILAIYVSGAWRSYSFGFSATTLLSDGTNVRVRAYGSSTTLYYQKF